MAGTNKIQSGFFVTTTAGEDETSEGNRGNVKDDVVDVAPPVPTPEGPVVQELDLMLDNPTDRALFQLGTLPSGNSSSRSKPPKRTACYQQL